MQTNADSLSIPVVDLLDANAHVALGQALSHVGLARLRNHGIPREQVAAVYTQARGLFALPEDVLRRYGSADGNHGYVGKKIERAKGVKPGLEDLKHFFHVHREDTPWPTELPEFQAASQTLFRACDGFSFRLATFLARYVGLAENTFDDMLTGGKTVMRVLHYPEIPKDVDVGKSVRAATHTDINFFTLLFPATGSGPHAGRGLQIRRRNPNRWVDVEHEADEIIVQVSDMLQTLTKWWHKARITNHDPFMSTPHRVANFPEERYSIVCFVHPHGAVQLAPGFTAHQALMRRLKAINVVGKNY